MPTQIQLDDYFCRSGDSKILHGNIEENKHGFCVWQILNDQLVLLNVYGDGRFWEEWSIGKAKELDLKEIMFATRRNPKTFSRRFNCEITAYIMKRKI